MSLVVDPFPEDQRIVAVEVAAHLREIDHRRIVDRHDLAAAWMQVHLCDSAVLCSLDPPLRERYRCIADPGRLGPRRPSRWSDRAAVRADVAHLRVALHRRLMVLQLVVNEISSGR